MRAALSCAARIACEASIDLRHEPNSNTGRDGDYGHHRQHDGITHIRLPSSP